MVDGFVESYSHKVEDVYKEHCRARMRLMEKRQGNSTYGLKAWWIYGTTDEILIMSKIKLEEFFMFQLERNRIETKTSQNCNENKSTSVVTNEQEPENDYWASKDSAKFLVKETAKNGTSTKYMT